MILTLFTNYPVKEILVQTYYVYTSYELKNK